jgi:hypothetical protein
MESKTRTGKPGMKRIFVVAILISAFIGTLVVLSGCAVVPRRRRVRTAVIKDASGVDVVYVQKAPPKAKAEVRPKKPGAKAIWVPGHWQWKGNKYVWVSGHWDANPRGRTWVPGRWEKRPRGWVWVSGHWR